MKIGYTSGTYYRRGVSGYASGSQYARFGRIGLHTPRNLNAMNRAAVESQINTIASAGSRMFEAKTSESMGLSEIAARRLLDRVKQAMTATIDSGSSLLSNTGSGSSKVNNKV